MGDQSDTREMDGRVQRAFTRYSMHDHTHTPTINHAPTCKCTVHCCIGGEGEGEKVIRLVPIFVCDRDLRMLIVIEVSFVDIAKLFFHVIVG